MYNRNKNGNDNNGNGNGNGSGQFWAKQGKHLTLELEDGSEIRVMRVVHQRTEYIDIRKWYVDKFGDLAPGKGVMVPLAVADLLVDSVVEIVKDEYTPRSPR
jgi:hypothetical protein